MSLIENITCTAVHCISLYIPLEMSKMDASAHLDYEIKNQNDEIVIDILKAIQHIVNVYKREETSVIIFMNESALCILTERPVESYSFALDNKFLVKPECYQSLGDGEIKNGDSEN